MMSYQMIPVETGYMCSVHSFILDWLMEHLEAVMVPQEEGVEHGSELCYNDNPF